MFPAACSSLCWLMSNGWVMALLPICLRLLCFSWVALERMMEMAFSKWEWLILTSNTQWVASQYSLRSHKTASAAFKLKVIKTTQQQRLKQLWGHIFSCNSSCLVVEADAQELNCHLSVHGKTKRFVYASTDRQAATGALKLCVRPVSVQILIMNSLM